MSPGFYQFFIHLTGKGRWISSSTPKIRDSKHLWPGGFDRAVDGSILFPGGAESSNGDDAPFIALISPDGTPSMTIQTAPYYPYSVSFAPDGTFWTLGLEMINHNARAVGLDPKAGVLRHYDRKGNLLASGIAQSPFIKRNEGYRLTNGLLIVKNDRVGWVSGLNRHTVYSEISPDTLTVTQTSNMPFKDESGNLIVGFTMTDSGRVFLCVQTHKNGHGERSAYALDRTSALGVRWRSPCLMALGLPRTWLEATASNWFFSWAKLLHFLKSQSKLLAYIIVSACKIGGWLSLGG